MLARANRLRAARDITRVYKRGVYGGSGGVLSLKAAPSGRAESRAVVVVAKKVSKRAVVRNRARRRLSEALRGRWATVKSGYDIVLSVHTDISELPAAELREHLDRALTQANLKT